MAEGEGVPAGVAAGAISAGAVSAGVIGAVGAGPPSWDGGLHPGALLEEARAFLLEAATLLEEGRRLASGSRAPGSLELPRATAAGGDGLLVPGPAPTAPRPQVSRRSRLAIMATVGASVALSAVGIHGLVAGGRTSLPTGGGLLSAAGPQVSAATAPPASVPAPAGPGPATAAPVTVAPVALTATPQSLSIPGLASPAKVSSQVVVQTTGPEQGLLTAPDNYHDLGWYRHGTSGVLAIDGHVGYRQDPGPLASIGQLSRGSLVTVTFADGPHSYRVAAVAHVVKGQLPAVYFSPTYDGQVMLITCDYTSVFSGGHFADNVYVIAAPM